MGERSVIEWTDATVNFWRGCDKVDPTCAHCYMFRDQRRYGQDPSVVVRCGDSIFTAALSRRWRAKAAEILATTGRRMRIFTCSWSDFFHPDADQWRDDAWDIIRRCPQYDWQILTSRPELISTRIPADWRAGWPHVWLGTTIGNRAFAHRAQLLLDVPAAVRFVSAEPLLGPLVDRDQDVCVPCDGLDLYDIDWLIVGGESGGPQHRRLVDPAGMPLPHKLEWVRDLRDHCIHNGDTAFFFKQWGGARPDSHGRLLDGRTWDEFPRTLYSTPAVSAA